MRGQKDVDPAILKRRERLHREFFTAGMIVALYEEKGQQSDKVLQICIKRDNLKVGHLVLIQAHAGFNYRGRAMDSPRRVERDS